MSFTEFSMWVNGFGFAAVVICGFAMLIAPRHFRSLPVPCLIAALTYFYLAVRIVVCSFVPITSVVYLGHGAEFRAMFGMSTALPVSFIFLQLSRYRHINAFFVAKHFAIPVVLMAAFVVCASMGIDQVLPILFRLYVLDILIFTLYHFVRTVLSSRRYETELLNIYVSSEARSIRWFWYVSIVSIVLFSGNMVVSLFVENELSADVYHIFSTFLWIYIAYRIVILRDANVPFEEDMLPQEIEEKVEETQDVISTPEVQQVDPVVAQALHQQQAVDFVQQLRKTLEEDDLLYDEDLNRDMVTRRMGVTHITLGKYLREVTDMTFAAYVCDLRLEHIAQLIATTHDNIDQIYYSCGFRSRTTFYRAFARKYNCSPVEYRNQSQGEARS